MSDQRPPIHAALAAVMADVQAVRKGDRNPQQGYVFRGIDAVMNAVGPVLRRHGVIVVPSVERAEWRDCKTSTGKASRECTVIVRYTFHGPAGDYITCSAVGEAMDFGDKAAPKAMSVAFRTALLQALCLPTDEPDPDHSTFEREHNTTPAPVPSAADRARDRLRERCAERGWDMGKVAARFPGNLKTEDSADSIDAFAKALDDIPVEELAAAS